MANVFMSGFEWKSLHEFDYWTIDYLPTFVTNPVRSGNYALKIYSSPAGWLGVSLKDQKADYFIQFAFYTDGMFGSLGDDLFHWYGYYGDKRIGKLNLSDSGQIRLYTCDSTVWPYTEIQTLRCVGKARLRVNTWYVIELHIKADLNYGVIACHVDGVADSEYIGPTSPYSPGTIDAIKWSHWSMVLDDIIVNDTTGSFNNAWPGCLKVVLLRPNEVGSSAQWIKSEEGLNYDLVNEVPFDATQYLYTAGLDQLDLYNVENVPEETDTVPIVRGDAWAFKNSGSIANNRTLAFSVQPSSTVYDSSDQDLNLSYQLTKGVFDYNPDTNAVWTKEEVNNILAGIKSRA
jgi:hypothetical protein